MIKSTIEADCTGQFSPLFLDYIQQNENLKPFYHLFPSLSNFKKIIEARSFDNRRRTILTSTLQSQYEGFEISEQTKHNLDSLNDSSTFTVTTGHQLNLFTGPLYFIYKIVSTINLATKLKQAYPSYNFVPVYWMASEDHDFEEINHFYLDGKNYSWSTGQKGAVGEFELDQGIRQLLKEAAFAPEFFKRAYLEQKTLAGAVRHYVNHLFGDKGIVVVDANAKEFKTLFKPVIKDDVVNNTAKGFVDSQSKKLEQLGYNTQIFPREINFFYLDKSLRERIEKVGDAYIVLGTELSFSESEILDLIDQSPEKFSPNVVMRPLYQEYILPNIAYLGGPAEVAYWLQLKPVFEYYETPLPAIMPRNFVMIVDTVAHRKMQSLKLEDRDIFMDYELWKKDYVTQHARQDISLVAEKEELSKILEQVGKKAQVADPTLQPSAMAAQQRVVKILDQFARKLRKAEERHLDKSLTRMRELKKILFPEGSPQERKLNFLSFYLEDPQFIEKLYAHLDPLDFDFIVLRKDAI